jgi:hypothetical protein
MQGWEGEMDTVHAAFLHFGHANYEKLKPGSFDYYMMKKQAAKFSVIDTDFGTSYGAYRPAEDDTYYWRIAHMLFPFFAMIPQGTLGAEVKIGAYVPMDDSHTLHWEIFIRPQAMASGQLTAPPSVNGGARPSMNFLPTTSDWFGRYNIDQTLANDYKIDREAQRKNESYTGIPGVRQQDMAVTETMGPIYDRSREHLGTTDQMIIRTRRKLIATAKALRENGVVPPGVDTPDVYLQRSGEVILPRSADWWESVRATTRSFLNNEMENQVPAHIAVS